MDNAAIRRARRARRKSGLRKGLFGTPQRPRLSVFRSHRHTYAQIIDDLQGRTLASASSNEKGKKSAAGGAVEGAVEVGEMIARRAAEAGISAVLFDRNGYRYHGRVKALADAARAGGLKF